MEQARAAAPMKAKIKPAFMVQKLDGKVKQVRREWSKEGSIVTKEVEVDAGWLVTFPKGHSIRVFTEKEMARLGFDQTIPLVNMEDGEVVGEFPNLAVNG